MKAINIATIVYDSTAFCPTKFKECTAQIWTMVYYDIFHFIESSRHIAGFFITLGSIIYYNYIIILKKSTNRKLSIDQCDNES